jgi:hypothetical protein
MNWGEVVVVIGARRQGTVTTTEARTMRCPETGVDEPVGGRAVPWHAGQA